MHPVATISPALPVADVGSDVVLTCNVNGGPNNVFQWGPNLPNETMSTLTLTNVTVNDAGNYSCAVSNDAGSDEAETELFIAPNIITPPEDMFITLSDNVTFTCVAEGVPVPSIRWEYVGNGNDTLMMNNTNDSTTTVSSTLTIEQIAYDSYGVYRCVAYSNSSEFREVSANATLYGKI